MPVPIVDYRGELPRLGRGTFVAPNAFLSGDLETGADCSFWFGVVARGDVNSIRIGDRSNVQDGAVLHVTHERFPLHIGDEVVIGHGAIVHGCTLESRCLIGIGATVLDGAVVESGAQVGAGALVPPGMRVPSGSLVVGVPAKVLRPLSAEEVALIPEIAERYVGVKDDYVRSLGPGW
jgi:carbonic anhydrase/acetyltransferase-like protein (isoleucine patch superfamily)